MAKLLFGVIGTIVLTNHYVELPRNIINSPHGPEKKRKKGKIRKYVK